MIEKPELRTAIGENIRRLRVAAGWTQSELAGAAGIGQIHVNRIENGKTSLSAEVLFAIADALNVSTDSLRQISFVPLDVA